MSDSFTITEDRNLGSAPVLRVAGRLDAEGAQELREAALALKDNGHNDIVIDLKDLEFVASSGLGTFLLLTEEFHDVDGQVVFVGPGADVRQVISLLNIDQFLTMAESVNEAFGWLQVN